MTKQLLLTALIATAGVYAQEAKAPETKAPELPGPAIPLCSTFSGGPVMILDGSANLKFIYKPTAADLAPLSLDAMKSQYEALMSRFEITVKTLPNGGTVTTASPRATAPKPEPK